MTRPFLANLLLIALFLPMSNLFAQDWAHYPNSSTVKKYEKFELILRADYQKIRQRTIDLTDDPNDPEKLNPFNPDYKKENGISLEALFTSPTGIQHKVYGFYMEDWAYNGNLNNYYYDALTDSNQYKWRIRFSPNEVGNWSFSYTFYYSVQPGIESYTDSGSFMCKESGHHGFLKVGANNAYLQFDDGTSFFGIGENLYSASFWSQMESIVNVQARIARYQIHRDRLVELAANHGNYGRFWTSSIDYAFDFRSPEQYLEGQIRCFEIENFVEMAEQNGIYLQFVVQNSWGFGEGNQVLEANWEMNPYNNPAILDSQPDGVYSFFKTERVKTLWERKLRYFVARWGYSKNIACWELWNEPRNMLAFAQNAANNDSISEDQLADWLVERAKKMVELFPLENQSTSDDYNQHANFHPIMGATNNDPFVLFRQEATRGVIHLLSMHAYGSDRTGNHYYWNKFNQFENPLTIAADCMKKPMNWGEIYAGNSEMDMCTHLEFHRKLWATAMAGGFSTGLSWFFGTDHGYGRIVEYADIASFFKNENLQEYGITIPGRYPDDHWYDYFQENKDNYPYMQSIYMVNNDKSQGMGWTENPSHYWYNFPEIVVCADSATAANGDALRLPSDDDENIYPIYNGFDRHITIKGLNPGKWYKVEWYRTQNLKYFASTAYQANDNGEMIMETPMSGGGDIDPNDPFYPDYAFKFYEDLCGNNYPLLHNGWERVCGSVNHPISKCDKLVVGDFDGDSVDDILGFDSENRSTFFKYENETFNNTYCSNDGDASSWDCISANKEKMWIGDFDGDSMDEILGYDSTGNLVVYKFDKSLKRFYRMSPINHDNSLKDMALYFNFLIGDFDGNGKDELIASSTINNWVILYRFNTLNHSFEVDHHNSCLMANWDSISYFTNYLWSGNFDKSNDLTWTAKDEIFAISFELGMARIFEFSSSAFHEKSSMPILDQQGYQLWEYVNCQPWNNSYEGNIIVLDFDSDGIDEIMAGNKSINAFTEFSLQIVAPYLTTLAGSFKDEIQIADMPAIKIEKGEIQKFNDGINDMLLIQMQCGTEFYVGLYQKTDSSGFTDFPSPTSDNIVDPALIYPNPSTGMIEVESILPLFNYEVFDYSGRKLKSEEVNGLYYLKLNFNEMPQGLYILKLCSKENCNTYKIMIIR
ncbi:MAG: DUF5060 domain-containing protein [Bacteroidales bacterium]|nr:DUF5060 domain-containing protein [Bacteroidales bacterium]MCF8455628.1 DUF5060 domain-containing protein [Bacteroidales bacterium]